MNRQLNVAKESERFMSSLKKFVPPPPQVRPPSSHPQNINKFPMSKPISPM